MSTLPSAARDGLTLQAVYQPIVDLHSGHVLAVEGLIRGVRGDQTVSPAELFAEATRLGPAAVLRLDEACMRCVLGSASALGPGTTVFVNVEPATLAAISHDALVEMAALVSPGVQVVVEVTERNLLRQPAQLLAGLQRVREIGWRIAIDDVGAEQAALALMSFVCADVIKLDLALVQECPTLGVAAIVNAVNAEAQRSGALVLAEGIETASHLEHALSLGATLGQGWHFARPGPLPATWDAVLSLPPEPDASPSPAATAFDVISHSVPARPTTPAQLAPLTHQVERQAMLLDEAAVVLASFQDVDFLTPEVLRRYEALAKVTALTAILAPGVWSEPAPGVFGATLHESDALSKEWVVTVISPHFAAAIAARDVPSAEFEAVHGERPVRHMEYVLTYDRGQVVAAASLLMAKVKSRPHGEELPLRPTGTETGAMAGVPGGDIPALLARAIATASNGIVIADAQAEDSPLVYVNAAFEGLTGFSEQEALGRNCRFLQGPDTDHTVVQMMSRRMRTGREVEVTLLNYRRDGSTFWNEITVSPVHDAQHRLTHFIGNQVDVSDRVDLEQRTEYLAYHDALTGLPNRAYLMEQLDLELRRSRRSGTGVAVVYIDISRSAGVDGDVAPAVGDRVLARVAQRLRSVVRTGDVLAHLGGDEFVLVLTGVPGGDDTPVRHVVEHLHAALSPAVDVAHDAIYVSAQIGLALAPRDGDDAVVLLGVADERTYEAKRTA
ncbi:MAG: EAL domain-containing protein [Demequina sp.]